MVLDVEREEGEPDGVALRHPDEPGAVQVLGVRLGVARRGELG